MSPLKYQLALVIIANYTLGCLGAEEQGSPRLTGSLSANGFVEGP